MIGPPLPPGMTKDSKTSKEEDLIGPPLPPGTSRSKDEDDDEDDEDDEPEEVRIRFFSSFPYKLYVLLFYFSVNATIWMYVIKASCLIVWVFFSVDFR